MIGWIMLSRQAVASAEAALKADQLGVRDEIGFLTLHQAFADRFFPGTSVLHTRLRYALFVPWLMEAAEGKPDHMRKYEMALTLQLNRGSDKGDGVIGGSIPNRAPVQPASMIYWTALARWNILHPRSDGVISPRSEILRRIAGNRLKTASRHRTDDGDPIEDEYLSPFVSVPPPPVEFLKSDAEMDFCLADPERTFLRNHLLSVQRSGAGSNRGLSLLARLAEARVSVNKHDPPWAKTVRRLADAEDKSALDVAKQVSALAGIGRSIYAALVEEAKSNDGSQHTSRHHDNVKELVAEHSQDALALDLSALSSLVPALPGTLKNVLGETQTWLKSNRQRVSSLRDVYQKAESQRKGSRARLASNMGGVRRRAEWNGDLHPLAEPLHFRWGNVCRLLNDLEKP